jgi:hypothetical protein
MIGKLRLCRYQPQAKPGGIEVTPARAEQTEVQSLDVAQWGSIIGSGLVRLPGWDHR